MGEKLNHQPTGCSHPALLSPSPPPVGDPQITVLKGISALECITGERGVNRKGKPTVHSQELINSYIKQYNKMNSLLQSNCLLPRFHWIAHVSVLIFAFPTLGQECNNQADTVYFGYRGELLQTDTPWEDDNTTHNQDPKTQKVV